ncbi:MAG: hypothetical protein E7334_05225 [Clostridiales bacterium]|nr:hypothetical protein [Clostridiales bacterium]
MRNDFPKEIYSGKYKTGHCQGIAIDEKKGYVYYSFTTCLIKTDLDGKLIASAYGLLGHLGCIAFNEDDGMVYGSLEYKNDAIGKGILKRAGQSEIEDAFYIAIFDVDKLTKENMDAAGDGIMKAVYLKDVIDDYKAEPKCGVKHRYGCSGIDGLTIAPIPGTSGKCDHVFVAYGIYGDNERDDNDYQIILSYPVEMLKEYAAPIAQSAMHKFGPEKAEERYFVYTGNTTYGIQNLEYDKMTGTAFAAVYKGKKPGFKNPPMFAIDWKTAPKTELLKGIGKEGKVLTLGDGDMNGIDFEHGSTGLYSFGDGNFAVSHHGRDEENAHYTYIKLYKYEKGNFTLI